MLSIHYALMELINYLPQLTKTVNGIPMVSNALPWCIIV